MFNQSTTKRSCKGLNKVLKRRQKLLFKRDSMVLQASEQQEKEGMSPSWSKIKDNDMIHMTK